MTTAKDTLDEVQRVVDEMLASLCARPAMWGANCCVELQFLALMDLAAVASHGPQEPRRVLDAYRAFCGRKGFQTQRSIAMSVGDRLPALLREFRTQFQRQLESESNMTTTATTEETYRAPSRLDAAGHAMARFIERWWPLTPTDDNRHVRERALELAVVTGAYLVETIPDECQSIWAFVVTGGPNAGRTALMVVAADGTVRTVLPPEAKRPVTRRKPPKTTAKRKKARS